MNMKRLYRTLEKTTSHVTYVMSSTFRVLDNHGLYFAHSSYDTCNIIIYRRLENKLQNDYFDSFIPDLTKKLGQFGKVSIVYDYKNIQINNDIVVDKGYLKEELLLERYLIRNSKYSVISVESNIAVPVETTSNKEEYSARTIRPKIHKHLQNFIDPVLEDFYISDIEKKALAEFELFIKTKLPFYHLKNHPELNYSSSMSTYLKYGIISPIRILVLLDRIRDENKDSFIEEIIIRRELSYNFIYYNKHYDNFNHMTYNWAYSTMNIHQDDDKEYLYDISDYICYKTHDEYFNAAMKEMVHLGKMHGYMRMYWCKKIIEWSPSFNYAYATAIYLNNHYFLDGNTPNGYTGVAWCFGKHDRAWGEREIFGKLRYMNANGLIRKFDINSYVKRVEREVQNHETSKTSNTD